jgi:Domain of unknown function (DUF4177)
MRKTIMKSKSKRALMIAAIALLFFVGLNSKAQRASKTTWEYRVVTTSSPSGLLPSSLKELNELGDEGWEMVTVVSEDVVHGTLHQTKLTYYLKRPT